MTASDESIAALNEGRLFDAISIGNKAAAADLDDLPIRIILTQLLCIAGNLERAGKILRQITSLDSGREHVQLITITDALIQGEERRRAVWREGVLPGFLEEPGEREKQAAWSATCLANGNFTALDKSIEKLETLVAKTPVTIKDEKHEWMFDLSELSPFFFEAISPSGEYYWIPFDQVRRVEVTTPVRPIDRVWCPVDVQLTSDQSLKLFFCNLYPATCDMAGENDALLTGKETHWTEIDGGRRILVGRKVYLLPNESEISTYDFNPLEIG